MCVGYIYVKCVICETVCIYYGICDVIPTAGVHVVVYNIVDWIYIYVVYDVDIRIHDEGSSIEVLLQKWVVVCCVCV